MARYEVYRHPVPAQRKTTPYLLDVQNNYISAVATRVVVPLRPAKSFGPPMRDLNPAFMIEGIEVLLDTTALAAIPAAELGTPIANLQTQSALIADALDTLFY